MEPIELPADFSEFLRSLDANEVEYLLVGGFAVALYGYPRATADLDVWISRRRSNTERIVSCLRDFGFDSPDLTPELFEQPESIVRMGNAPIRIEILNDIDGVEFDDCMTRAERLELAGVDVVVISLEDLKVNKRASGRPKDLDDLLNLP
jgi:predicted nucleotidyltransferase